MIASMIFSFARTLTDEAHFAAWRSGDRLAGQVLEVALQPPSSRRFQRRAARNRAPRGWTPTRCASVSSRRAWPPYAGRRTPGPSTRSMPGGLDATYGACFRKEPNPWSKEEKSKVRLPFPSADAVISLTAA
jgi:hypothetical protein